MICEDSFMNCIQIKGVRNKNGQQFTVEWLLNIETRKIEEVAIDYKMIKTIFGVDKLTDVKDVDLVLLSSDKSYYCHNCIFGFKIFYLMSIHNYFLI